MPQRAINPNRRNATRLPKTTGNDAEIPDQLRSPDRIPPWNVDAFTGHKEALLDLLERGCGIAGQQARRIEARYHFFLT